MGIFDDNRFEHNTETGTCKVLVIKDKEGKQYDAFEIFKQAVAMYESDNSRVTDILVPGAKVLFDRYMLHKYDEKPYSAISNVSTFGNTYAMTVNVYSKMFITGMLFNNYLLKNNLTMSVEEAFLTEEELSILNRLTKFKDRLEELSKEYSLDAPEDLTKILKQLSSEGIIDKEFCNMLGMPESYEEIFSKIEEDKEPSN